jgi:NADPH:quinone reductase-like Zn-dependent oxidoreductase
MQPSLNRVLALVISILCALAMPQSSFAESATGQKALLVTGASSGIGRWHC